MVVQYTALLVKLEGKSEESSSDEHGYLAESKYCGIEGLGCLKLWMGEVPREQAMKYEGNGSGGLEG